MRSTGSRSTAPRLAERLSSPPPAQRILVIRLGALGDVVRTRFALEGLRALYPEARIDWLVEDRAAAGLAGQPGLHEVIVLPRTELRWRHPGHALRALATLVRRLRERRYDLTLDFHGIFKSALLGFASGSPLRVGYGRGWAREGSQILLTHRVRAFPTRASRFARNALLVRYLGGEAPSRPPALALPPAPSVLDGLPEAPIVLHPGTSPATRYKRWDPARYAELAIALERRLGAVSLVSWGPVPGEREVAEEVVSRAEGAARLAPALPSLAALLALLQRARLFVGSDSGPMHLASLAECPVLGLFGPTDPVENAPFEGVPSALLRHDVGCNPCRKGCPARSCMAAIEVEEVLAAALELVAVPQAVD
ncbi:MAG: glycosyltransferase family 9 protein [Myxococcota bacterium]